MSKYFSAKNPEQEKLCSELAREECIAKRVLCICNVILTHPLFKNIPREETHKLSIIADVIKLEKGRKLFFKGESIEQIFFVLEGKLKLYSIDQDSNKVFINQIINIGDVVALESIFAEQEHFTDTAEALKDSTVLLLHRSKLKKIILNNPVILENLLSFISKRNLDITERMRDHILSEVPQRLLKFLETQSVISNAGDELDISKTDLAYVLGTVPATLSRAIKKLQEDKLVKVTKYSVSLA